jgi:DNA-binding HxlR family transcriptional regulator
MAERDNQSHHDLEQDEEIVELTEVIEEGDPEEPLVEEPIDSEEDMELAPETAAENDSSAEVISSESAEEPSDSSEDLDFDVLFEELEHESENREEEVGEHTSSGVTFGPEDEGEVTGGIHTPDEEDDFDALLEDLDKQEDMLPYWDEPEEPSFPEEPSESFEKAADEDEEDSAEVSVGSLEEPVAEELEAGPAGESPLQEIAPESGIDPNDLAERLQRLENEQMRPRIDEEDLARALSSLSSEADIWTGLEERLQKMVDQKIREHTGDFEARVADLQEKVDRLASADSVSQQALDQQLRDLQAGIPSRQELEEMKQTLQNELTQELESRIPAAAARVIREEIENLRSGSEG